VTYNSIRLIIVGIIILFSCREGIRFSRYEYSLTGINCIDVMSPIKEKGISQVRIIGTMPSYCYFLDQHIVKREGEIIWIYLYQKMDNKIACRLEFKPYTIFIPISGLTRGIYQVIVNNGFGEELYVE